DSVRPWASCVSSDCFMSGHRYLMAKNRAAAPVGQAHTGVAEISGITVPWLDVDDSISVPAPRAPTHDVAAHLRTHAQMHPSSCRLLEDQLVELDPACRDHPAHIKV